MTIAISTFVLTLGISGWESVGGQLLTSVVILLSVRQDLGLRVRIGAGLGSFVAIAFVVSALVTAIRANLPYAAAICAVVLFSETVLILRWWLRRTSA